MWSVRQSEETRLNQIDKQAVGRPVAKLSKPAPEKCTTGTQLKNIDTQIQLYIIYFARNTNIYIYQYIMFFAATTVKYPSYHN